MASDGESAAAETEPLRAQLRDLEGLADGFGRAMTTAFRRSVVDGKRLEDVLRSLALSLSSRALNQALAPIGQGIGGLISGVVGNLSGGARVTQGGPRGAGAFSVAGVANPNLRGIGPRGVNVTFHVTTPDAASFRRAEADLGAVLARAVSRGQRGM